MSEMDGKVSDLVSIITPAYKVAAVIDETIKSVRAQSYQNWELLIADDCSPDETRNVVRRWVNIDPRIKLIELKKNGGPASARNAALVGAAGRWIAFLDSDDIWLPMKLEESVNFALSKDAALVFTGFRRFDDGGHQPGAYIGVPSSLRYRQLLGNTAIATSTVLIDSAKTGPIRMKKTYYDDFVCWLDVLKMGFVAYGLNRDLMRYRVMGGSVSRNKKRSAHEVWKTYRHVEKLSLPASVWYFSNYAVRAARKYSKL
jgi:teichuronic acid biosynthesis glycosyltransferase TuaG